MGRAAFVAIDPLCKPEDTATLLRAFERDVPGMKHYVAVSDRVRAIYKCVGGGMGPIGSIELPAPPDEQIPSTDGPLSISIQQ